MGARHVQISRMEQKLARWGAKLDAFAAQVSAAGAEAKADERQLVADMRAMQTLAHAKLDELKAAGEDEWETFKAGVRSAYDELESAYEKLVR